MSRWTILDGVQPSTPGELRSRLQIQFVSDAYKSMQARLDGYRSSAGAIFLAVIASSLTFDTTFVRLLIDPTFVNLLQRHGGKPLAFAVVAGSGLIVVIIGLVSHHILTRIARFFSEMTSIVYKIDLANEAWTKDRFIEGTTLYPLNFKRGRAGSKSRDVAVIDADRPLPGWSDPAIASYTNFTAIVTVLHAIYYAALAAALNG